MPPLFLPLQVYNCWVKDVHGINVDNGLFIHSECDAAAPAAGAPPAPPTQRTGLHGRCSVVHPAEAHHARLPLPWSSCCS